MENAVSDDQEERIKSVHQAIEEQTQSAITRRPSEASLTEARTDLSKRVARKTYF